ncbi:MAG: VCBS repeat-containing protein, partial [Flavobacteriales bacterium]|nr:VCBS repeat-containing protein [Flavobacteriales bacterium]
MKKSNILFSTVLLIAFNLQAQTFTKVTQGPLVSPNAENKSPAWGDYDNDGDLDLFVGVGGPSIGNVNGDNLLYQNNCNGQFTRIVAIPGGLVSDGGGSSSSSWIDYNNDGNLDLFVGNGASQINFLYKNNGDGTFTKITNLIITDPGTRGA